MKAAVIGYVVAAEGGWKVPDNATLQFTNCLARYLKKRLLSH